MFFSPFVVIVAINYSIDNANIFISDSEYNKLGKLIASGNNITNLYNFKEFLTRKYAIMNIDDSLDIVSFGSSRIMQLNSSVFPKKKFFNMGVSAISLREIIACYNVVSENRKGG